nr:MAG TPA: homing endonuclease [Caudoviricetes sp.]
MSTNTNRQSAAKLDIILKPFPIYLDGYESKYKVSNDGRIWSEYLNGYLKPYYSKGGYMRVKVNFGERNKKFMVHRLVAMAFIPNDDVNKTQVDHIDSNRINNNVDNLRWVTPKENTQHSIKLGKRNWYKYKFINPKTKEILEFNNSAKACKYFGVSLNNSTLTTKANTGTPVRSGVFEGWIIERELFKKVQRPSSAEE